MEDILNKLYEIHSDTNPRTYRKSIKENLDEEWRMYDVLYAELSEKQRKMFIKYVEICGMRQSEEMAVSYESGFKTAIRLIAESLKE